MKLKEEILFYAFRYVLGRRTYAVSDVSNEIIRQKINLSERVRKLIVKEIEECEYLGDDCDKNNWDKVLKLLK